MTNNHSAAIVQRLWNYCNVLRDGGVSDDDNVEQPAYQRFLNMDDEAAAHALPQALHTKHFELYLLQ